MRRAVATVTPIFLISLFFSFPIAGIHAAHKAVSNREVVPKKIYFPYNAEISGIRPGYNTAAQLEHRLWPGATFSRDRPDRAAVWKVKTTGWIVEANEGDCARRGQDLSSYWIKMPGYSPAAPAEEKVCYIALPPRLLSFNNQIRLGMPKRKVLSILSAMHIPVRGANDVSWSALNGGWEASFEFNKSTLVAMGIEYS